MMWLQSRPWQGYVPLATGALAVLATVALAGSGIGWLVEARGVNKLTEEASGTPRTPAATATPAAPNAPAGFPGMPAAGPDQQAVQAIVKRNIFSPPMPPVRLTAVLGSKAYFSNGMSGEAGANLGTMKVVEVGATWAKVEMEGRQQEMYVFGPSALGGGGMGGLPPGFQLPPGSQLPPGVQLQRGAGSAGGAKPPRPARAPGQ